jgi:cation:H+ antiporter
VLAAAYVVGMRAVYRRSRTAQAVVAREETVGEGARPPTLRAAALRFAAASVAILAAAPVFARSARALAELTGLGTTVVGTLLVGLATSLPELVTSLAAVRLRAFDLAVGNLFGSNAVNMLLLLPVDLAAPGPPLLDTVGDAHALTALVGIGMMAVGLGAIVARSHGRMRPVEPASLLMLAVYAAGSGLLYLRGAAP